MTKMDTISSEQTLHLMDIIPQQPGLTVAETVAEPIDPAVLDVGSLVMTYKATSDHGDEDDD